jgi:hypothetical protein
MCGSPVNANIPETVITGGKDPGNNPGRAGHGNQDIGKTTKRVTNGIRAAGRGKRQRSCK